MSHTMLRLFIVKVSVLVYFPLYGYLNFYMVLLYNLSIFNLDY